MCTHWMCVYVCVCPCACLGPLNYQPPRASEVSGVNLKPCCDVTDGGGRINLTTGLIQAMRSSTHTRRPPTPSTWPLRIPPSYMRCPHRPQSHVIILVMTKWTVWHVPVKQTGREGLHRDKKHGPRCAPHEPNYICFIFFIHVFQLKSQETELAAKFRVWRKKKHLNIKGVS